MIDFTPALRAQALENLKKFRWEQTPFVPYVIPNDKVLGTINVGNTMGGVNWPGSSFDPETGDLLHAGEQLARCRRGEHLAGVLRARSSPSRTIKDGRTASRSGSRAALRPATEAGPAAAAARRRRTR